ncbi:hypothetical protein LTR70_002087 [Exophiala xenobiotica]|nr:hypothetical protein LTR70_002087 [Exophiala xenobiotica]
MVRHRLRTEDAGAVSQASEQRTKRGRLPDTGSGGEDASHPERKRRAAYKLDLHLGKSRNQLIDALGATALSKNGTEDSSGDSGPELLLNHADNRSQDLQAVSETLPAFDADADLVEIRHFDFSNPQPYNGSKDSQSLTKPKSSDAGNFKPRVGNQHVGSALGEAREQPFSSTSLMRPPSTKGHFETTNKMPTSEANGHAEYISSNEAPKQQAHQLNRSTGLLALTSAASQPQAVQYWKTQYGDIQKELDELRSQCQDLIKKEKARESATKAWSKRRNDIVRQDAAARHEVIAAKKEADEMRSELVRVKEERDREKTINADLEENLRLAQEGLQVAEWEERLRVAETRCKDAETGEDEVTTENEKLEIRVAAAEASSKLTFRQARSAQYRLSSIKKKQQAAENDAEAAERQGEACLRALTTACAQITTLKEQLNTVATTELKRGLNEALTAKNEEIADLRKLVEAHNVVLALTGKNKEVAGLKRVIKALEEELEQFYKRAV